MTEEQAGRYGRRIVQMEADLKRVVKPNDVVDDARSATSAFRDWFQWDDAKAAESYRLAQARTMMNSIMITVIDGRGHRSETRALHLVVVDGQRGYASASTVLRSEELRQQVVENALNELMTWNQRYDQYQELYGVRTAIAEAVAQIKVSAK